MITKRNRKGVDYVALGCLCGGISLGMVQAEERFFQEWLSGGFQPRSFSVPSSWLLEVTSVGQNHIAQEGEARAAKYIHPALDISVDVTHSRIRDMVFANNVKTEVLQGKTRLRHPEPQLTQYHWENETVDGSPQNRTFLQLAGNPQNRNNEPSVSGEGNSEGGQDEAIDDHLSSKALKSGPVVYRYYGRSRGRVHTKDSIPFVLLGPSVDHWKSVGQTLAARGFSAIACERITKDGAETPEQLVDESASLILAVADALRWKKVILVGCDGEAALATAAALQLAPDRVAGLVLCGDVSSVRKLPANSRFDNVDSYLDSNLGCPFSIVWDGGDGTSKADGKPEKRYLILGGGDAPHRREPEHFSWALTRFVEERVAPKRSVGGSNVRPQLRRFQLPGPLKQVFSPEGLVVVGRVLASTIIYVSLARVVFYQFENLHTGILSAHSKCSRALSWSRSLLVTMSGFVLAPFRLFGGASPALQSPSDTLLILPQLEEEAAAEEVTEEETVDLDDDVEENENHEAEPEAEEEDIVSPAEAEVDMENPDPLDSDSDKVERQEPEVPSKPTLQGVVLLDHIIA